MKTHKEMLKRLNWYVGRYIDFDGAYGAQCMDLAVDFVYWATNGKVRLWGNAIDAIRNDLGKYGKVIKNSKNFVPKVGDIAVWTKYPAHPLYGHIGIVYGNVNINTCSMLDQNWFGDSTQGAILRRGENYQGITHFIRLNFKGESVKNQKVESNTTQGRKNPWKKNKFGTYYMKEKGIFTVGNEPIIARSGSPKLNAKINGSVNPRTKITYDEVCLSDGHAWIGYQLFNGTREYLPIRTWDNKAPTNQGVGKLWGSIKLL